MNISHALFMAARVAGCRPHQSDMRLKTQQVNAYSSPDVMAVCASQKVSSQADQQVAQQGGIQDVSVTEGGG